MNGESLPQVNRENLVAERIAIETYSEIVRWLGDDDPTTRRVIEGLLSVEEEHADDLKNMLEGLPAEVVARPTDRIRL